MASSSTKDMQGLRFTRLVVVSRAESDKKGNARWHCLCDCGNATVSFGFTLRNGTARSCGCLKTEEFIARNLQHDKTGTPEHRCWINMRQRCTNPNEPAFANYGARGVTICKEWESYEAFYRDMGPRPK